MTKCVIEAVKESGVYAIISKGWSDRLSSKKHDSHVPEAPVVHPRIFNVTSVPHDWLFQRIDAACHHGGAGTTGASLRGVYQDSETLVIFSFYSLAGIPTVIKPFFGDQYFWADRVETLGIGSSVRKLTVENLTAALTQATTDKKQIERAKAIGVAIREVSSSKHDLDYLLTRNLGERCCQGGRIHI
jgi:sterol 3beta-glucosyltransferase